MNYRYGEIVLLDCTYNTSCNTISLCILAAKINHQYFPLSFSLLEKEDASSFEEMLHILKLWNPD